MFNKTFSFEYSSVISTLTQTLFNFHLDTNNLPKITPPWINVKIVSLELPLHKGSTIELDIKRLGFIQKWNMLIAEIKSPTLVCDQALQSPFASFIHYHHFEPVDENRSMMRDELFFTLPLYPLSLIAVPFIKKDLKKMFSFRHQQTKLLLEKENV